jgi:hypothetical protein
MQIQTRVDKTLAIILKQKIGTDEKIKSSVPIRLFLSKVNKKEISQLSKKEKLALISFLLKEN